MRAQTRLIDLADDRLDLLEVKASSSRIAAPYHIQPKSNLHQIDSDRTGRLPRSWRLPDARRRQQI